MSIPYTYLLICPDGRKYYGVKWGKDANPETFWVDYTTSSKEINELLEIYSKEDFRFEIRKIFKTAEEARSWESRVLKKLKVSQNPSWVNQRDIISIAPMYGDDNPSRRPEVRDKISKAKKGKKRPDASERMRTNHPLWNPETRIKFSENLKNLYANGDLKPWNKGKERPEISGENHPRYGVKYQPMSDMNRIERTCPHCNKIGKGPGMLRYHFDNCKNKPIE